MFNTTSNYINMILSYLYDKKVFTPKKENTFTPALCNRIDQGTEGIVIAAKNYRALADMNTVIRDDLLEKRYLCITQKAVKDGIYTAFLKRDKTAKKVTVTAKKNTEIYYTINIVTPRVLNRLLTDIEKYHRNYCCRIFKDLVF